MVSAFLACTMLPSLLTAMPASAQNTLLYRTSEITEVTDTAMIPPGFRDTSFAVRTSSLIAGFAVRTDEELPATFQLHDTTAYLFTMENEAQNAENAAAIKEASNYYRVCSYAYWTQYAEPLIFNPSTYTTFVAPFQHGQFLDPETTKTDDLYVILPKSDQENWLALATAIRESPLWELVGEAHTVSQCWLEFTGCMSIRCRNADAAQTVAQTFLADCDSLKISGATIAIDGSLGMSDPHYVNAPYTTAAEAKALRDTLLTSDAVLSVSFVWNWSELYDYMEMAQRVLLPPTTIPGDTNENGKLEATDAQLALQAYVAVHLTNLPSPLTATQLVNADMDGDGDVSLQDAMAILQLYVTSLTE